MRSSYGATPPPAAAPTVIITADRSNIRLLPNLLQIFRCIHLLLNVFGAVAAGCNYSGVDVTSNREAFLTVSIIFVAASFILLAWRCIVSRGTDLIGPHPIYEVFYYSTGSALLVAATLVLAPEICSPDFSVNTIYVTNMRAAMVTGSINAVLYLASAIMLWKLTRTT